MNKCICGESAVLKLRAKRFRVGNYTALLKDIPVYVCEECGESWTDLDEIKRGSNLTRKLKEGLLISGRKIDRMTPEDFREMNDLKKEKRGEDIDLPDLSSESHWYIKDIQAQQIINTPSTQVKEKNVFTKKIIDDENENLASNEVGTTVYERRADYLSNETIYYKALRRVLGNVKDAFYDIRPEADPMMNLARIKRIAEEALEFHDKEK